MLATIQIKNRIKMLLDEVESNLRGIIIGEIEANEGVGWWADAPNNLVRKCKNWRRKHAADPFRISNLKPEPYYMSMGDLITLLKNYQRYFSNIFVEDSPVYLNQLVVLRDTISHPNEVALDDISSCRRALKGIVEQIENWNSSLINSRNIMDRFDAGLKQDSSKNIHNLPTPPYGEFVGRIDKLEDIETKLLYHPTIWYIQIDGIGGIGKTSLAYRIAQRIVEEIVDEISEFQHVIWLSAKTRRLTYDFDTEEELPDFQTLENLLDKLLDFFGIEASETDTVSEKTTLVTSALEMTQCLLVFDNLETITDNTIYRFIERIPSHNKVLLTSRHKQLGNALPLEGLSEEDSIEMILTRAKQNNIEKLLQAPPEKILRIAEKTYGHPIILEAIVHQIYLHKTIDQALSELENVNITKIFDFCFSTTFYMLEKEQQKIMMTLALFESSVGAKELALVLESTEVSVNQNIENLLRFSLVKESDSSGSSVFNLLPVIRDYVRSQMQDNANSQEVMENFSKYSESLSQIEMWNPTIDPILQNFQFITTADRFSAMMATSALNFYNQTGAYSDAVAKLDAALRISPQSAYVCQVRAVIEKFEQSYGEAAKWYAMATHFEPQNQLLWKFWGDMERGLGNYARAKVYYEKATKLALEDRRSWHGLGYCQSQLAKECWRAVPRNMKKHDEYRRQAVVSFKNALYEDIKTPTELRNNVQVFHQMGFNMFHLRDYDGALECAKAGLSLDNTNEHLQSLFNDAKGRVDQGKRESR
ncbi:NB-ARC domain-containing protein [Paenibacillus sp. OK003]|uniref:NB-ARC domain-containing protein n=1 Tax=Paenibacillus sp. OK003 TaxID=1884380 RepID=UPI0008BE08C4|nr:NB-ARC domain-containing protein [Paenibacillus sp. OK003]SEL78876.1 NB-ARC domain-containing protein [Paenibacillus sp. OK003]